MFKCWRCCNQSNAFAHMYQSACVVGSLANRCYSMLLLVLSLAGPSSSACGVNSSDYRWLRLQRILRKGNVIIKSVLLSFDRIKSFMCLDV